jgi:putative ATPase
MRGLGYGRGYQYAHSQEGGELGGVVDHAHLPENLAGRRYYEPREIGHEATIRKWMAEREATRRARRGK